MMQLSQLMIASAFLTMHSAPVWAESPVPVVVLPGAGAPMAPAAAAPAKAGPAKGGAFTQVMEIEPPTLHPIISQDYYSEMIKSLVMDTLLARDPNTYEWVPRLAEKWEISKDKKVFTFHLRKNAVFHDGQAVSAEDVKFSFDAIFEPKYKATHLRPYFESIDKVEVLDPSTIKITAKESYFMNFAVIATAMYILPKHIYSDVDKSTKLSRQIIGSGPYVLEKYEKNQRLTLKRFDKWYGASSGPWKDYYNFDQRIFRFIKDDNTSFDLLKKGELDFLQIRSKEVFVKNTEGAPWGKTVLKNQVENSMPKDYSFVGFNFRREIFKDKNVRLALAHLMNREQMIKDFQFDLAVLATGPTYVQSDYASKKVQPISYDPGKAVELLYKAGWKDPEKKGVLHKNIKGKMQEFRFTLIHASKDREKYWLMFKNDLHKVGIEMDVRLLDWNAFLKQIDQGDFDALAMGWGGTLEWDPKQIWHSSSVGNGGSNFIAYKNTEVDKLIDKARNEMDRGKRIQMLHKVYELIAGDVPYIFMFNDKYYLYASSSRVTKPAATMKFDVGIDAWWVAKP